MNIVDRVLKSDSGFRLLLYLVCIIILAIYIIIEQKYRTGAMIILFIGAVSTARQYYAWRLKKRKELEIGKYKEQAIERAPDA